MAFYPPPPAAAAAGSSDPDRRTRGVDLFDDPCCCPSSSSSSSSRSHHLSRRRRTDVNDDDDDGPSLSAFPPPSPPPHLPSSSSTTGQQHPPSHEVESRRRRSSSSSSSSSSSRCFDRHRRRHRRKSSPAVQKAVSATTTTTTTSHRTTTTTTTTHNGDGEGGGLIGLGLAGCFPPPPPPLRAVPSTSSMAAAAAEAAAANANEMDARGLTTPDDDDDDGVERPPHPHPYHPQRQPSMMTTTDLPSPATIGAAAATMGAMEERGDDDDDDDGRGGCCCCCCCCAIPLLRATTPAASDDDALDYQQSRQRRRRQQSTVAFPSPAESGDTFPPPLPLLLPLPRPTAIRPPSPPPAAGAAAGAAAGVAAGVAAAAAVAAGEADVDVEMSDETTSSTTSAAAAAAAVAVVEGPPLLPLSSSSRLETDPRSGRASPPPPEEQAVSVGVQEDPMEVEVPPSSSSSLLLPEVVDFPLGQPTLRVAFSQEEGEEDVPPCFYPGQTIPTTLLFELPRYTTLAHALRPELTMSLVGVLRVLRPTTIDGQPPPPAPAPAEVEQDGSGGGGGGVVVVEERNLINVGVSLEEGLKLWAKDAGAAWSQLSERRQRGRANPAVGLPGGKYTLPLTVQVPTHPRLPPSFRLPGSSFEIVYELEVRLTIDRPGPTSSPGDSGGGGGGDRGDDPGSSSSSRVQLVRTSREFTLLPMTLPLQPPVLPTLDGLLEVPPRRPSRVPAVTAATAAAAAAAGGPSSSNPSSLVAAPASSPPLYGLGLSPQVGWIDKLQQALVPLRHTLGGASMIAGSSNASGSSSSSSSTHSRSRSPSPAPPPPPPPRVVVVGPAAAGEEDARQSWTIQPSLSTSAFSPSSNVPLHLTLVAPPPTSPSSSSTTAGSDAAAAVAGGWGDPCARLPEGQLLVKASVVRREHVFSSRSAPSKVEESRGLVLEDEMVSVSGAFDLGLLQTGISSDPSRTTTTTTIQLPRLDLPLGLGPLVRPWSSGMTTSLTVSPDPLQIEDGDGQASLHTHCSSRFYVALQVAYLPPPIHTATAAAADVAASKDDRPTNDFALDRALFIPSVLRSRSLLIPITIGSVGEPPGARHRRTWRELYLATDERTGAEAPRIVSGSVVDDERGWLLPPPSYETALGEREYVL